jgi:hypothetical protein
MASESLESRGIINAGRTGMMVGIASLLPE